MRRSLRHGLAGALVAAAACSVALACPARLGAQIPQKFENLQVFPHDVPRDTLLQTMRSFSFALGVRCQHCHSGGDGVSFEGVNFASDDKVAKRKARFMLRMVDSLNTRVLAALPDRTSPAVPIECVTCHRGLSRPTTLERTLAATIGERGVDSAVAEYRVLRREALDLGRYNFGEWSLNELARTLRNQGKSAEAVAMLELNAEFYTSSAAIDLALADLYRERGDRAKALQRYRRLLEKQPNNAAAKRRVEELSAPVP
jgi:Photosynthetic reaction centre cytochrome C subunit/Tetratricopeptide repeat